MLQNPLGPRPLSAERSPWLRGVLDVPGDTTIALLALAAAAMARGESVVAHAPETAEVEALAAALGQLGVSIGQRGGRWHIIGLGVRGLLAPPGPLDFGDTPLPLALVLGLVGTLDFDSTLRAGGEAALQSFAPLLSGLRSFGTRVTDHDQGRPPISLRGPTVPMPVDIITPAGPAWTKAGLILAAIASPGVSRFLEPPGGWNHAERLLATFGAQIASDETGAGEVLISVTGLPQLRARAVTVPADPQLAALGAVAASLVPGSEIAISGVLLNPRRTALLSALVAMGAQIEAHQLRQVGGEEVGDLIVRHAGLSGVALGAQHVGPLLDALPLLGVAAAGAAGASTFYLPPNLPLAEQSRLAAIARALTDCGVRADVDEEALRIDGRSEVAGGARVRTAGDAGIAAAFLVLGMAARRPIAIDDGACLDHRFPLFVERFEAIGASFVAQGEGRS